MTHVPYSELKKGCFLVASPEINDGIFFRSVVLLCDHSPVGSFGLVINKPLDVEIPEELLSMKAFEQANLEVRAGGPNQPNQIMLLHTIGEAAEHNLQVCDGVYLGGDLDCLQDLSMSPDRSDMLICFGYGGWGAGMLEREFLSGAWFLHPASKGHIFQTPPEYVWQTILREMGGKYKTLSMIPKNLDLN